MNDTNFEKVGEFHEKFDLPREGYVSPHLTTDQSFMYRYQHLQEELSELMLAHRNGDLVKVADALADLIYVAYGTAHFYGIPLDEVFAEVHRANMAKRRANDPSESKRSSHFDVVKPEGWTPPDIKTILQAYGADV